MTTSTIRDRIEVASTGEAMSAKPIHGSVIALINSFFHYTLVEEERDPSQAWFWTPEWQESVNRSLEQLERGEGTKFRSMSDFLDTLEGE